MSKLEDSDFIERGGREARVSRVGWLACQLAGWSGYTYIQTLINFLQLSLIPFICGNKCHHPIGDFLGLVHA